jgi:hypothetical protein
VPDDTIKEWKSKLLERDNEDGRKKDRMIYLQASLKMLRTHGAETAAGRIRVTAAMIS